MVGSSAVAAGDAVVDAAGDERLEPLWLVADLQLQEPCAGVALDLGSFDAVRHRRRERVLDRADEEVRGGLDRASGHVSAVCGAHSRP